MRFKILNYDFVMMSRYALLVGVLFLTIRVAPVFGDHLGREERAEPIFTQEAFFEKQLEFEVGIENQDKENSLEIGVGGTWVFGKRFEFGLDIPFVYRIPDDEDSVIDLSDLGVSAAFLICCTSPDNQFFLSVLGNFLLPTGDQDKGIGGTGLWGLSLNSGYFFSVGSDFAEFGIQLQFAYEQQLRLTDEEKQMANLLGIDRTLQKDLIWNLAFTQQYLDGRLTPVFELLGTSIVDALDKEEEGTIFELGFGIWVSPFPDKSLLNAVNIGAGAKFPLTEREESSSSFLLLVTYGFD
jgi:hypothetical protein